MRPSRRGRGRAAGGPAGGFHDPFDIFREVFGGGGGGSIFEEFFGGGGAAMARATARTCATTSKSRSRRPRAAWRRRFRSASSPPATAASGTGAEPGSKRVTCPTCRGAGQVTTSRGFFTVRQVCPACHGAGTRVEKPCRECRGEGRINKTTKLNVRIPPGVDTGSKLRSAGNGEAGVYGGHPGDLYLVIHVQDHEIFERQGDDLFCEIPIKFTLAALGGTIEVPTLSGKASLKIPPGTQSGTTFRLKDRGMPGLRSGQSRRPAGARARRGAHAAHRRAAQEA